MRTSFRELLEQGYSIMSPDYRGSTGYGRGFYEADRLRRARSGRRLRGLPMDARSVA